MSDLVFRRVRGRVVPIRKKGTNVALSTAGLATNIVSGVVSGLSLIGSKRRVFGGQIASFGLDVTSSGLNAAANANVPKSQRLRAIAKGEIRNNLAGYAAFGATTLLHAPTRQAIKSYASKALGKIGSLLGRAAL